MPTSSCRIDGVKETPASSPSGEMKWLTICPQGSFLFLTSILRPRRLRKRPQRKSLCAMHVRGWKTDSMLRRYTILTTDDVRNALTQNEKYRAEERAKQKAKVVAMK